MPQTATKTFTGIQPFWNYDSFSIANRMIGGGTGFINTAGGKWTITFPDPFNPLAPGDLPTVSFTEDMNFIFRTTDIALKFHNNSPSVTRFYNSTERLHTGSGSNTDSLPRHMGLMGRHWIFNYEHCLIHSAATGQGAIEIGPTGERNSYTFNSTSGTVESFTTPNGVSKVLTRELTDDTFSLVTPDYTIHHFSRIDSTNPDQVPGGSKYYYHLDYIEDRNGVRQYVEWERKNTGFQTTGRVDIYRYRIKQISVSSDQGATKIPFISFRYTSWHDEANDDAFFLIRSMSDMQGNEWRYQYDMDTESSNIGARLTKVTYPDGYTQSYEYTNSWAIGSPTVDDYVLTKITDRRGNDWEIDYGNSFWRIDNDPSASATDYHTTSYAWNNSTWALPSGFVAAGSGYTAGGAYRTALCTKTDPESNSWEFHHNCHHGPGDAGNLVKTIDPDSDKYLYFWDDPAADLTNDNHLYLTAKPRVATNADLVYRVEYTTTGNGFKLVSKTYPMEGTTPNFGVKGSVKVPQYVEYAYSDSGAESTVASFKRHQNFITPAYIEQPDSSDVTGLDDMTSSGTFIGGRDEKFTVWISATGTPDTFTWNSSQGGSGSAAMTGSAQLLQNGVYITFAATTGHIASDTWVVDASLARNNFYSEQNFEYDGSHNLVKAVSGINPAPTPDDRRDVESLDLTTYIKYDSFGNTILMTDARGNSSSIFYNHFGAVIRTANPLGGTSHQEWDELNIRLLSTIDAGGSKTSYSYDPLGLLIAVRDAGGGVRKTQYDPNGNVIGSADPKGHSGRRTYDKKNRLIETVSPSGVVREITYSKTNLLLMTTTTYWDKDYSTNEQVIYQRTFYTVAGKVTGRSLPSTTDHTATQNTWETNNKLATKYTYDANGNVLTVVDRYGQTTTNTYDSLDRKITSIPPDLKTISGGATFRRTTYTTDYNGPMGQISQETVTEENYPGPSWTGTITTKIYTYDRAGRTIIIQLPDHTFSSTTYNAFRDTYYDANGNVIQSQLRQEVAGTPPTDVSTWPSYMEYDAANRLVKKSVLVSEDAEKYDRQETTYEYDPAGRQVAVNQGGLLIKTTYDKSGRVARVSKGGCGCGGGGGCGGAKTPAVTATTATAQPDIWQEYEYDLSGNRIKHSDAQGVFASATYDCENRPVATTDRAGRVTRKEYWPTGKVKRIIRADGTFIGYEYDEENRAIKVWESIPEPNSAQAAGPFGGTEDVALTKTIEYYTGTTMPAGTGQTISWSGGTITGGYNSAVRTFTYKGTGPVYYDMIYTRNTRGLPEETFFIDSDDSTLRSTKKYYTWRDKVYHLVNPDLTSIEYTYDDHNRLTKEDLTGTEYYEYEYCLCGVVWRHKYTYVEPAPPSTSKTLSWTLTTNKTGAVEKEYYPYNIAHVSPDYYNSILYRYDSAGRRTLYSDPTFGHKATTPTSWVNGVEPGNYDDWIFETPQDYRYSASGGLEATGRVQGLDIMSGEGEPYFVQRDSVGRIAKVIYPNATSGDNGWKNSEVSYRAGASGTGRGRCVPFNVPSTDANAVKVWEIRVTTGPSGSASLYLDGVIGGVAMLDANGSGALTYGGVTIQVVNTEDGDNYKWTYTKQKTLPQCEVRYEYAQDGQLAWVSVVDQTNAETSEYGPEKYVVEYKYDLLGRMVNKTVRDTPLMHTGTAMENSGERYSSDYQYDGRGRLVRERILRYDVTAGRMLVTQDIQTTYDLGNNITSVSVYRDNGKSWTETRTYARGHQLITSSFSPGAGVTINTSGSFTYDTNNNLLTTKSVQILKGGIFLDYRAAYTFTYDRKNRLKSWGDSGTNVLTHLWWDGMGRIWQRWNSTGGTMDAHLTRYVYDGATLMQEHRFLAIQITNGETYWAYDYEYCMRDYLHQQSGVRQRESSDGSTFTDRYLFTDKGIISARADKNTTTQIKRVELTTSLDRQTYGSTQDTKLSNLASSGMFIEGYASETGSSAYYDPIFQMGGRHYLASYSRMLGRVGNNPYGPRRFGGNGGPTITGPTPSSGHGIEQATPKQRPSGPPGPWPPLPFSNNCSCSGCLDYVKWANEYCFVQGSDGKLRHPTRYDYCCGKEEYYLCFMQQFSSPCPVRGRCRQLLCGTDSQRSVLCNQTNESFTYDQVEQVAFALRFPCNGITVGPHDSPLKRCTDQYSHDNRTQPFSCVFSDAVKSVCGVTGDFMIPEFDIPISMCCLSWCADSLKDLDIALGFLCSVIFYWAGVGESWAEYCCDQILEEFKVCLDLHCQNLGGSCD